MYVQKVNREESIDELCARLRQPKQTKDRYLVANKHTLKLISTDVARLKKDKARLEEEVKLLLEGFEYAKAKLNNGKLISYIDFLITSSCAMFGTSEIELGKGNRERKNVEARRFIWNDIHTRNKKVTFVQIGTIIDGDKFSHATIIHGIKKHNEAMELDITYRIKCQGLNEIISNFLSEI